MLSGMTLPATDDVHRKLKDIQAAHQYKFKDDDIEKVCDSLLLILFPVVL